MPAVALQRSPQATHQAPQTTAAQGTTPLANTQGTSGTASAAGNAANAAQVGTNGPSPMDKAAELLERGDLAATAAHLQSVAAEQRKLWSSGGDRQLLSSALAALAVTQELQRAQQAKESGSLGTATQAARTAMGTLGRTPLIPARVRASLAALGASFGAAQAPSQPETTTPQTGARGTTPAASSQGTTPQAQRTTAPKPTQASQTPAQARAGYDPALGSALARRGVSGAPGTVGRCYEFVANAVDAVIGRFLSGGHAYMAASQLAARPSSFTEISASSLSSLPAGAIVVWGKGTSKSGHISIALGDGREVSDHVAPQMKRHYGGAGARVFLPKARMR
jgi:hypothetical protein